MTFVQQLLLSVVIATTIYLIGWRMAIAYFRFNVARIVISYYWMEIGTKVDNFFFVPNADSDEEPILIPRDKNNEKIELLSSKTYQLYILHKASEFFNAREVENYQYEVLPNRMYIMTMMVLKNEVVDKIPKLLNKYEAFPNIVKYIVKKQYTDLLKIKSEVETEVEGES